MSKVLLKHVQDMATAETRAALGLDPAASLGMRAPLSAAAAIMEKIGDLCGVDVLHNHVLAAIYIRPAITRGGIHLSDKTLKEDEFQGKVGLVLKTGPAAFVDDEHNKFHGQKVEPGQWIVVRHSDAWQVRINGVLCFMIEDSLIRGVVDAPERVY